MDVNAVTRVIAALTAVVLLHQLICELCFKENHMNRRKVFDWMVSKEETTGHPLLSLLDDIERVRRRMHRGILLFFWDQLPDLVRAFIRWLRQTFDLFTRIAARLARIAFYAITLLILVFGPVFFRPGPISILWILVAVGLSVWEFRRYRAKRSGIPPQSKQYVKV